MKTFIGNTTFELLCLIFVLVEFFIILALASDLADTKVALSVSRSEYQVAFVVKKMSDELAEQNRIQREHWEKQK